MKVPAHGSEINPPTTTAPAITIFALNENKRPIGYTAWTLADEKPKRKRAIRKSGGYQPTGGPANPRAPKKPA